MSMLVKEEEKTHSLAIWLILLFAPIKYNRPTIEKHVYHMVRIRGSTHINKVIDNIK